MPESSKKALNKNEQSGDNFGLTSNKTHELVMGPLEPPYEITIDIDINPHDLKKTSDEFTLYSTDDDKSYSITLSIKDDMIEGDDQITLTFIEMDPDLSYTLEVYPGYGDPKYNLFQKVSYADLKMAEEEAGYFDSEESEEPEEEEGDDEVETETDEEPHEEAQIIEDDHKADDLEKFFDELVEEEGLNEY